jgi:hypothetical protein
MENTDSIEYIQKLRLMKEASDRLAIKLGRLEATEAFLKVVVKYRDVLPGDFLLDISTLVDSLRAETSEN